MGPHATYAGCQFYFPGSVLPQYEIMMKTFCRSSTPNGFGSKSPATNMELSSQSPDSTRSSSSSLQSVGHGHSPSSSSLHYVGHSPDSGAASWLRSNDFGNQSLDDSLGKTSFLTADC